MLNSDPPLLCASQSITYSSSRERRDGLEKVPKPPESKDLEPNGEASSSLRGRGVGDVVSSYIKCVGLVLDALEGVLVGPPLPHLEEARSLVGQQ